MMTLSAQKENSNSSTVNTNASINCNENHYNFLANELSTSYQQHLFNCLENGEGMVISQVDFEDSERYAQEKRERLISQSQNSVNPQIVREYSKPRAKTVRTFDRRKASILALYVVMVLAVIATIALTIPNTVWEKGNTDISFDSAQVAMAVGSGLTVADQGLNVIMTDDGPVTVQLTPYEKKEETHTNWFDKLCDWVSNIVGG